MDRSTLAQTFRGTFNFFRVDPDELRRIVPDFESVLPFPQSVFLESEDATPLQGFAVLITDEDRALREALEGYLTAEERQQVALSRKQPGDPKEVVATWAEYEALVKRAVENATRSSFRRHYPAIFWLYHSISISRLFKEIPKRMMRRSLELGRERGDAIKYRLFHRYIDRVMSVCYDVAQHIAAEADEEESEHFPALLSRMRDNVLILTEDHISADCLELDSFFRGHLNLDGKEFRERFSLLLQWHEQEGKVDPTLRQAARDLLGAPRDEPAQELFKRPGYVRFLSGRPGYEQDLLLSPYWIDVWESLLPRLKEYEILLALRRLVIPVAEKDGQLKCRAPSPRGSGLIPREVTLSAATRPMEFMTPWVVDPLVQRFGLIYDITDFSAIVAVLRRSGSGEQDSSYSQIFRFQRRVNQIARSHRLKLEKYLGDGALYSGRHPRMLLSVAVLVQRYYARSVDKGFPFDRGLRIALNYGQYRLLPIEDAQGGREPRYEFFGHGIVELSRLATGKAMREIDEVKNLLLGIGYSADEVDRFFAPVTGSNLDVVDKEEESRRFYAYLNRSGALVNEGIVATEAFLRELDGTGFVQFLYRAREGRRRYVVFSVAVGQEPVLVGVRRLGPASLKGLGKLPVYEIVDGSPWRDIELERVQASGLIDALERESAPASAQQPATFEPQPAARPRRPAAPRSIPFKGPL